MEKQPKHLASDHRDEGDVTGRSESVTGGRQTCATRAEVHVCWGVTVEMTWGHHDKHWDRSKEGAGPVRCQHTEPADKPSNIQWFPILIAYVYATWKRPNPL